VAGAAVPSGKLVSQWAAHVGQEGSGSQPWLARRRAKWVANARSPPDPTDGRVYDPYVATEYSYLPLFRFVRAPLAAGRWRKAPPCGVCARRARPTETHAAPVPCALPPPPSHARAQGHGLSYTTFNYSALALSPAPAIASLPGGGVFSGRGRQGYLDALRTPVVTASVTVCNTGARAGAEVVQVYSQDPVGDWGGSALVVPHWKRLVGFARVAVAAGACAGVQVPILADDLAVYDDAMALRIQPGAYTISAGGRSDTDTAQAPLVLS
jgi:hypothetical protein